MHSLFSLSLGIVPLNWQLHSIAQHCTAWVTSFTVSHFSPEWLTHPKKYLSYLLMLQLANHFPPLSLFLEIILLRHNTKWLIPEQEMTHSLQNYSSSPSKCSSQFPKMYIRTRFCSIREDSNKPISSINLFSVNLVWSKVGILKVETRHSL